MRCVLDARYPRKVWGIPDRDAISKTMHDTKLLHEFDAPFDHAVNAVDAKLLRATFAQLVDRALGPLTAAHLDLDDVLLEHHAELCDTNDLSPQTQSVELITLADRALWISAFDRSRSATGVPPCNPESTRFKRIRLKVLREIGHPVPDFSVRPEQ